jgi:molybdopterin synthase sulfur carrier subunit
MKMLIRYFAAARAAAGIDEEQIQLSDGSTLDDVLQLLIRKHGPTDRESSGSLPALGTVIARSSFLRNAVACKDRSAVLEDRDVIDILPPFAGG